MGDLYLPHCLSRWQTILCRHRRYRHPGKPKDRASKTLRSAHRFAHSVRQKLGRGAHLAFVTTFNHHAQ